MTDRFLSLVRDNDTTSRACRVLSTEMHQHCPWPKCDCLCHEQGTYGGTNTSPRRPHSFPRPDWEMGKRPKTWKEEKEARKRQERLLGLV
jgi:hypothetical protein